MVVDHDRISFTYWMTWKNQGKKYYGVRHCKGSHYFDLGVKYKSSSKYVKAFIKEHGEPEYKVDRIFLNTKEAVAYETEVLKSYDAANNPDFLNRWNGAEKFVNKGGYNLSSATRVKQSAAKRGKTLAKEHRAKLSDAHIGRKMPTRPGEWCLKLSNALKGAIFTEERCANISKSLKGKKQTTVQCPHCGKVGGSNSMKRYHFDNCKERVA